MSEGKIRVGMVNYLNTLPLRYGLERMAQSGAISLLQDYPARIADALLHKQIDLGLVPVAAMLKLPDAKIIGQHCISADGAVASVALFSQVPLQDIRSIMLDYQSRTSVRLVQILCKHHWQINPNFVQASNDFIDHVQNDTAAVIIGDRALQHKHKFAYEYDLSAAWKELTSLPFVFAVWLSPQDISPAFCDAFDAANGEGLAHLSDIVAANPYPYYDLHQYLSKNIQYTLTAEKRISIEQFLAYSL
ncbi:MAG: hypothetical protein RL660_870 [Bacteroidota bacterium]|jgi:chorismate dehydratase